MKVPPRILVLGANGQVGWELCRTLAVLGEVIPSGRGSGVAPCDLADMGAVERMLERLQPDAIVNAAAYTAVDAAETDAQAAYTLNAELPGLLGHWAAAQGEVPVVHYSTDYVFDGELDRPYTETDATGPGNVYGASKLQGDQSLLESGAAAWILRVSWVYGARGRNFLLTMRRLMQERDSLSIVDDQHGAPTWSRHIAEATGSLLGQVLSPACCRSLPRGLFHLAPAGSTSWFGFAGEIRRLLNLPCELRAIASCEYPTPARRPMNSRLDSSLLASTFGIRLPDWKQGLADCLGE